MRHGWSSLAVVAAAVSLSAVRKHLWRSPLALGALLLLVSFRKREVETAVYVFFFRVLPHLARRTSSRPVDDLSADRLAAYLAVFR